ncbi:MAG TPA: hypothetical protein VD866_30200 [Urbifossiella sp.]|nr:hypothetical protein [Urbifossiella sp.]
MQLVTSSDGKINGSLGKTFQVTLDGTNGTLKFFNFKKGESFTVLLRQDSTGSRTATWPAGLTWQAVNAPTLQSAAGAVDVFQFTCTGTGTYSDGAGAPNRLPARVALAGLSTILGAGAVALTLVASNGTGSRPGPANIPSIVEYCTGTGCSTGVKVGKLTASGELVLGQSGALAIGSPSLGTADAKFRVLKTGAVTTKSAISGATLTLNIPGAGIGHVLCPKASGQVGYRLVTATGTLAPTCN